MQGDIQRFKCQACGGTFSSRKGTPLYYVKTATGEMEEVLWYLAEGVDISVLVRRTGHKEETLSQWLNRIGKHSARLHDLIFRELALDLVQMDELYAKVRGTDETRWLWLAIDPVSKILPALHLGGRRATDAYALVHELKRRLRTTLRACLHHRWFARLFPRGDRPFRMLVSPSTGPQGSLAGRCASASWAVSQTPPKPSGEIHHHPHVVG
jgi:hypothetical protein